MAVNNYPQPCTTEGTLFDLSRVSRVDKGGAIGGVVESKLLYDCLRFDIPRSYGTHVLIADAEARIF